MLTNNTDITRPIRESLPYDMRQSIKRIDAVDNDNIVIHLHQHRSATDAVLIMARLIEACPIVDELPYDWSTTIDDGCIAFSFPLTPGY